MVEKEECENDVGDFIRRHRINRGNCYTRSTVSISLLKHIVYTVPVL